MSILVKIFEISRFWSKKYRFWWIFFKNLNLCQTFEKNPDFSQDFRKIAILVKILENIDFGEDFRITSILVKLSKSIFLNFGQNRDKIFEKSWVKSKFLEYLDFGQNLEK